MAIEVKIPAIGESITRGVVSAWHKKSGAFVDAGGDRDRAAFSPGVRRIIEEEKLDPEKIRGTGEGGRLTKGDVLAAAEARGKTEPVVTEAPSSKEVEPSGDGRFTRKKMCPLRRKIAQQLVMAQHTAAILTTFN